MVQPKLIESEKVHFHLFLINYAYQRSLFSRENEKIIVCRYRFKIVYYNSVKTHKVELRTLSRFFIGTTAIYENWRCLKSLWKPSNNPSETIDISVLFFYRMKINMQNGDAYSVRHKIQPKVFDSEKVQFNRALKHYAY